MIPPQPYMPWKVALTILHALAILSTCLRLEHRRRTRKLWWDDYITIVPVLLEGLNIPMIWLRIRDHPTTPMKYRVLMSYANLLCFTTMLWFSRISLAFAVVRITPSWTKGRRIAVWMTVSFFVFWLALFLAMILTCTIHTEWQKEEDDIPICGPSFHVTIGITIFDVMSDLVLIAVPLNLLWNMSHPSSQRRLVRLVFSASVLTLLGSLTLCIAGYTNFMIGPGALLVWLMICYIETGVSIITSNLLVLVCWFYHYLFQQRGTADESDAYITPHWSRARQISHERENDVQTRQSVFAVPISTIGVVDTVSSDSSSSSERSKEEPNHLIGMDRK